MFKQFGALSTGKQISITENSVHFLGAFQPSGRALSLFQLLHGKAMLANVVPALPGEGVCPFANWLNELGNSLSCGPLVLNTFG